MPASIFERSPTSTSDARLGTAYFFAAASTDGSVAFVGLVVLALQLGHRQALAHRSAICPPMRPSASNCCA